MSLGPFDLTGGPFLFLYLALFLITVTGGFVIPRRLRPEGRRQRVTDLDQTAWLAGGRTRFADALVARMLAAGSLRLTGRNIFSMGNRDAALSTAERGVIALEPPIRWRHIAGMLKGYAGPVERKLEQAGLLMSAKERASIAFWATLPYLMLFVFGATKWVVGDMRHRPIGILTAALIVTALCAVIRSLTIDRRTKGGLWAVEDRRMGKDRLRRAPTVNEVGLAVALFGTAALAASPFADYHRLRTAGGSDGGAGGPGCGSDGGSGCGGGGCGGCGS